MSWVFCHWQLKAILTDTNWVFCLCVLCCSPCQSYPLWQQNHCNFVSVDHVVQRWQNLLSSPASQSPKSHLDWTSLDNLLGFAPRWSSGVWNAWKSLCYSGSTPGMKERSGQVQIKIWILLAKAVSTLLISPRPISLGITSICDGQFPYTLKVSYLGTCDSLLWVCSDQGSMVELLGTDQFPGITLKKEEIWRVNTPLDFLVLNGIIPSYFLYLFCSTQ